MRFDNSTRFPLAVWRKEPASTQLVLRQNDTSKPRGSAFFTFMHHRNQGIWGSMRNLAKCTQLIRPGAKTGRTQGDSGAFIMSSWRLGRRLPGRSSARPFCPFGTQDRRLQGPQSHGDGNDERDKNHRSSQQNVACRQEKARFSDVSFTKCALERVLRPARAHPLVSRRESRADRALPPGWRLRVVEMGSLDRRRDDRGRSQTVLILVLMAHSQKNLIEETRHLSRYLQQS